MTSRPAKARRYLVQTRDYGKPWRLVARVWDLERALRWMHDLKQERHAGVRVLHGGAVVESIERGTRSEQEA